MPPLVWVRWRCVDREAIVWHGIGALRGPGEALLCHKERLVRNARDHRGGVMMLRTSRTLPDREPAPGELVQVRSRRWLVEEVIPPPEPRQSAVVRLACAESL